jgi:hypothetical protein
MPPTNTTAASDSSGHDGRVRDDPGQGQSQGPDQNQDQDHQTTSTATRWAYTNDLLAGWVFASFAFIIAASALGRADLEAIPSQFTWGFVLLVAAAGTWAFGVDLLERFGGAD